MGAFGAARAQDWQAAQDALAAVGLGEFAQRPVSALSAGQFQRVLFARIMVQDAPLMTTVAMPSPLLARMAREIENVRYVKVEAPPTAPKITALKKLAGDSLTLFGGLNWAGVNTKVISAKRPRWLAY